MPGQGRLGDKANAPVDAHGCPACPHPATGPAIAGSPDVNVNGRPAVRVGDNGIHGACCGSNGWTARSGSATVFINGKQAHRLGDATGHCGGLGRLVEGSPNVIVGDTGVSGGAQGGGRGGANGSAASEGSGSAGGAGSAGPGAAVAAAADVAGGHPHAALHRSPDKRERDLEVLVIDHHTRQPVHEARVSVGEDGHPHPAHQRTSSGQGLARFAKLKQGHYDVVVDMDGYFPFPDPARGSHPKPQHPKKHVVYHPGTPQGTPHRIVVAIYPAVQLTVEIEEYYTGLKDAQWHSFNGADVLPDNKPFKLELVGPDKTHAQKPQYELTVAGEYKLEHEQSVYVIKAATGARRKREKDKEQLVVVIEPTDGPRTVTLEVADTLRAWAEIVGCRVGALAPNTGDPWAGFALNDERRRKRNLYVREMNCTVQYHNPLRTDNFGERQGLAAHLQSMVADTRADTAAIGPPPMAPISSHAMNMEAAQITPLMWAWGDAPPYTEFPDLFDIASNGTQIELVRKPGYTADKFIVAMAEIIAANARNIAAVTTDELQLEVVNESITDDTHRGSNLLKPPRIKIDDKVSGFLVEVVAPHESNRKYIIEAFKAAHRATPGALLLLNDYDNEVIAFADGREHLKGVRFRELAEYIQSELHGARLAVGFQMHLESPEGFYADIAHAGRRSRFLDNMKQNFQHFQSKGIATSITELTITPAMGDQKQIYQDVVEAALEGGCQQICWWGFSDDQFTSDISPSGQVVDGPYDHALLFHQPGDSNALPYTDPRVRYQPNVPLRRKPAYDGVREAFISFAKKHHKI
jgi:uncharacterized Zn-binding protein involved in type VI secretion